MKSLYQNHSSPTEEGLELADSVRDVFIGLMNKYIQLGYPTHEISSIILTQLRETELYIAIKARKKSNIYKDQ